MAHIRKRQDNRTIIDYAAVAGLEGNTTVICVDLGVLDILRQLIRSRGLWATTYYTALLDGDLYVLPNEAEMDLVDGMVSGFLAETDMTTCSELSTALINLTDLLENIGSLGGGGGACACGSGGAGGTTDPPTTQVGPPDIDNPTGEPPAPWDTWDEYRDYRCAVAHTLVDQMLHDVQWLDASNLVTLAAVSVVAAFLTPIPGDEVIAFIGLMVTVVLLGYAVSVITQWENVLTAAYDDLVCVMYYAETVEQAQTDFNSVFLAELATIYAPGSARYVLIAQAQQVFQSFSSFNDLFVFSDKYLLTPYDQTDCALCDPCPIIVAYGSIEQVGATITITSELREDGPCPGQWAMIWFCGSAFNGNPNMKLVTLQNFIGSAIVECPGPSEFSVNVADRDGTSLYSSDTTFPTGSQYCCRRVYVAGQDDPFTFDIVLDADCT